MNTELYIHTLRTMCGEYEAEHMETETEALDAAIQALQTQTEVFLDGTLSITVNTDVSQIRRVLVSQSDTQYGTLYYADGKEYEEVHLHADETHDKRTETHGVCLDTISRKAAIDMAESVIDGNASAKAWTILARLKTLPSAQPEIIRCKDCVKREHCRTTNVWAIAPSDDWYCADAERRTDG